MKIDELMRALRRIREQHGNIEVTCTGSTLQDGYVAGREPATLQHPGDVFETTVENLIVGGNPVHGKSVRLWL